MVGITQYILDPNRVKVTYSTNCCNIYMHVIYIYILDPNRVKVTYSTTCCNIYTHVIYIYIY
mgnify:CR=1 FL=1